MVARSCEFESHPAHKCSKKEGNREVSFFCCLQRLFAHKMPQIVMYRWQFVNFRHFFVNKFAFFRKKLYLCKNFSYKIRINVVFCNIKVYNVSARRLHFPTAAHKIGGHKDEYNGK